MILTDCRKKFIKQISLVFFTGVLTGLHYAYLLIGMLLSHITSSFYSNYFVDLEIVAMSILNFVVLLVVDDLPYYWLKFSRKRDCILCDNNQKIKDYENCNAWNHFYTVSCELQGKSLLLLSWSQINFCKIDAVESVIGNVGK